MRDGPHEDYYALLRVARTATAAELRRSYRLLALRYHPDRAGPEATEMFQRIARAYAILSDNRSRRAYDGSTRASSPRPGATVPGSRRDQNDGQYAGMGGRVGWRVSKREAPIPDLLMRLSGRLEELIAQGVAQHAADGAIELHITRAEAVSGGTATLDAAVPVPCPTCGGSAQRYVLWCRRCEYVGSIVDHVTFRFQIPPWAADGTSFSFASDPTGATAPLRLRLRIR
jgi:molecular chaperone DnaJ